MNDQQLPEERRHFRRIHFDCDAFLETDAETVVVQLRDISLNGALVIAGTELSIAHGDVCRLRIELPGENQPILMSGTIAHREGGQAGLSCQQIDIDSAAHLRRIVELNLGDPELLSRELAALG